MDSLPDHIGQMSLCILPSVCYLLFIIFGIYLFFPIYFQFIVCIYLFFQIDLSSIICIHLYFQVCAPAFSARETRAAFPSQKIEKGEKWCYLQWVLKLNHLNLSVLIRQKEEDWEGGVTFQWNILSYLIIIIISILWSSPWPSYPSPRRRWFQSEII